MAGLPVTYPRRGRLEYMNERLREELKTMAAEDRRLRQELLDNGELGDAMRHGWRLCIAKMPLV